MRHRCYICGDRFSDLRGGMRHFKREHPNHLPCFEFQCSKNYPLVVTPSSIKPSCKMKFGVDPHDKTVRNQRAWLRYDMSNSCVVSHLEDYPPLPAEQDLIPYKNLLSTYYPDPMESFVILTKLPLWLVKFDLAARTMCESCGGYGRKRHCPPIIKPVEEYKEWIESWDAAYVLIWQSDGRAGWPTQPNGVGRRWGRTLRGTDMALSLFSYAILQDFGEKLVERRAEIFICPPGPCKRCGGAGCSLPIGAGQAIPNAKTGFCKNPIRGGPTPEAMGVDVIRLMLRMGIPIQQPVLDFVTKVGMVLAKGGGV